MAELDDLSTTDDSNTARFPENMQFRNVNDSARKLEGMLAREFKDRNMSIVASGSSNAFAVTTNRTITSLSDGLVIGFQANHSITGTPTLNVNGLGAKSIVGANGTALGSGEIVSGQKLQVVYRSATGDFQVIGGRVAGASADVLARVIPVGTVLPWPGSTAPAGYLLAYGQAVSRTTYAELFAAYGTTYGSGDGSTTFNLPDYRGRTPFGKDDMGGTAASRITTTFSGVNGATLGAVGGAEGRSILETHLPPHNHSGTLSIDPGGNHSHGYSWQYRSTTSTATAGAGTAFWAGDSTPSGTTAAAGTHTHTGSVTVGYTGGGTVLPTLNPAIIQNWIILALPAAASAANLGVNGLLYKWSTGTSDTNPGSGKLGFNNSTLSSATQLYISETDAAGAGMAPVLATWDDSTSTTKGTLYVYKVGQLSTFCVFTVSGTITDGGSYDKFTVSYVGSDGTFAADDQLAVMFVPKGDKGDSGLNGDPGEDGGGILFTFDSSTTTNTDPGTGDLRLNNATLSSVTEIAISYSSAHSGNPSAENFVKSWDDSTNTTHYGYLKLTKNSDPNTWALYNVTSALTDGTTYGRYTVSYVNASPTSFTAADTLSVHFTRTGNKGADGAGSGDVTAASAFGTDNRLIRSDGASKGVQASAITVDDSGNMSGVGTLSVGGAVSGVTTLAQSSYTDLTEISAPSSPSANVARLYAFDVSTVTRMAMKDSAGVVSLLDGNHNIQAFTSSGTFTTPAHSSTRTVYRYVIVGAGGGGGGADGNYLSAGGGGGGAIIIGTFTGVAASTGITITVGSGGTAGSSAGGNGGAGGSSSIGTPVSVTANGGSGALGAGSGGSAGASAGGAGGSASGGTVNIAGMKGQSGGSPGTSVFAFFGGMGASGPFGGGGSGGGGYVSGTGTAATGYGAGGGGGVTSTAAGGAGSGGLVIIEWVL